MTQVNAAINSNIPHSNLSVVLRLEQIIYDIKALEKQGIAWSNAAGCNAQAVAEYVITALLYI